MKKTFKFFGEEYTILQSFGSENYVYIRAFRIVNAAIVDFVKVVYRFKEYVTEVDTFTLYWDELEEIKNGLVAATTKTATKEINDTYIVPQGGQEYEHPSI